MDFSRNINAFYYPSTISMMYECAFSAVCMTQNRKFYRFPSSVPFRILSVQYIYFLAYKGMRFICKVYAYICA